MTQQLYIPEKLKVGFVDRKDTYTQKLAFVTYYDQKGVLKKERTWENWRDQKIDPVEYNNVPTTGFVLNKGVGGVRQSYGWNTRNEYIRVYDPRNFEIEISVSNLLFILRECDCSRGKGLEGEFVYAWDRQQLVLLPVISEDYKNSQEFTKLQSFDPIKAKDLVQGATYQTRRQEKLIYLGKFDRFEPVNKVLTSYPDGTPIVDYMGRQTTQPSGITKSHTFKNEKGGYVFLDKLNSLAVCISDVVPNYAELMDEYINSKYGSKVEKLFLKKFSSQVNSWRKYFYCEESPGIFVRYCYSLYSGKIDHVERTDRIQVVDGIIQETSCHGQAYSPKYLEENKNKGYGGIGWNPRNDFNFIEPTENQLFARLETGAEFRVADYSLKLEDENGEK